MKTDQTLFGIWGGVRKLARDLRRPASTVHGWKKEGRVPANEQPHVLAAARRLGLPITADHVVFPLGHQDADAATIAEQVPAVRFNETTELKRAPKP